MKKVLSILVLGLFFIACGEEDTSTNEAERESSEKSSGENKDTDESNNSNNNEQDKSSEKTGENTEDAKTDNNQGDKADDNSNSNGSSDSENNSGSNSDSDSNSNSEDDSNDPAPSCKDSEHIENNACVANEKGCNEKNGSGMQTWDITLARWGNCIISNCDKGYSFNDKAERCEIVDGYGSDLKSCKSLQYNTDAKNALGLTDQNWCGDFRNRFSKNPSASANDFVYDWMLRGYWSPSSSKKMSWADANTYCSNLGSGFKLPDAYELISLIAQTKNTQFGYINAFFDDNDKKTFWSSTASNSSSSSAWDVNFDKSQITGSYGGNYDWARCFRSADY